MSTTNDSSPPPATAEQQLIPSLPDDVALICIARVPRWHHPSLSAVSKPFRSLLSSPLFFAARSLLHSSQHFLYLSLRLHHNNPSAAPSAAWFALYQKTNPSPTNPHVLIPLPTIPAPTVGAAYAVAGPTIYVLGGSINDVPSSQVWLLDCRFHTWRPGPPMRVAREFAAAGVVDGKVYVIGGCVADSWARTEYWAEVLDPDTNRWEPVPSPVEVRDKWMHASAVMGGRVYAMADRGGVVYDPRTRSWEAVEKRLDLGWRGRACVVKGILYCYDYLGKIRGFDTKRRVWKEVKGVEKGLPKFLCGATMANVGDKLVVLWEEKGSNGKEIEIWCAEIEVVENVEQGELCGAIDWSRKLVSVAKGSSIINCVAVSL